MIPAGWHRARVADVARIVHGLAFDGEFFRASGTNALVTPGNFFEAGGFRFVGDKQRYYVGRFPSQYQLAGGDLIVAMTEQAHGLLGSAALVPKVGSWLHNQRIGRVLVDPSKVRADYLQVVFNSADFRVAVNEGATGTKVRHTSPSKLEAIEILIPPRAEQDAICEAFRDASDLVESIEQMVVKKQAIKNGMLQQLLTGRTRLPGFSGEWTMRRVGDFTQVKAGGTPSTAVGRYWGGDVRWMSSGEIHVKRVHEVKGRITSDGLRDSAAQLLPAGTVLMALAGQGKTRGTVAVSRVELSTNQSIAGIVPSSTHESDFLFYNLDMRYDELRGESSGDGGRGGLNLTIIKNLDVLMPPKDEQSAIAQVLAEVDDEIDQLRRRVRKARATRLAMMQELLSGRTRLTGEAPL